jgi:hypothetical protein
MVRLVKKPTKRIIRLCRKYRIKISVKRGSKRVYKTKRVLMKQLRKKMKQRKTKRKSRFGSCGCGKAATSYGKRSSRFGSCGCGKSVTSYGKRSSGFGKTYKNIKKLHRICKTYGVKVGKKSPEMLRKQCLKKVIMIYKRLKRVKRT